MKFQTVFYRVILFFAFFIAMLLSSCSQKSSPQFMLQKSSFNQLTHWEKDNHYLALQAFQKSCNEILNRNPSASFGSKPQFGLTAHWQTICKAAKNINSSDDKEAKNFFETWFVPYAVTNNSHDKGLFTGYYLPLIQGSLTQDNRYRYPIYGLPNDLVNVNLQDFSADLPKRTLTGQIKNQALVPYPDRAQIDRGMIHNHAPILFWGDNKIDIFFAQIQGSAAIQLPDGRQILIGYAGQNGRPYKAIGKLLIDNHGLDKETIAMQSIRTWLEQHPKQVNDILNSNQSYVFFRVLETIDPIGSEQIPLTAKRSLAVDTQFIPLGAPLWLETTLPGEIESSAKNYRHLLVAQDTGGSIKGIVRGDIYWGAGNKAAVLAGQMKNSGSYWLLIPRNVSISAS